MLFVGGSKDGQTLHVPFMDGNVCLCIEMQPQAMLREQLDKDVQSALPIKLEQYRQQTIDGERRRLAISLDLQLNHYDDEVRLPDQQVSVDAAHQLRAAVIAYVHNLGGRIVPTDIGQEDITVEIVAAGSEDSDGKQARRLLRGQCWFVTPVEIAAGLRP